MGVQDFLLEMAKSMRPYPRAALIPERSESAGVVSLTYKSSEPPGSGVGIGTGANEVIIRVELVQEQGWKLKSEWWKVAEKQGTSSMNATSAWSY